MAASETILVLGQNLFFLPRIQNVADPLGYHARRATDEAGFWDSYREVTPALILVDLEGDRATWTGVVQDLRAQPQPRPKIVAFGPHADVAALKLARELGCDTVLTKGEFSSSLQQIVQSQGAEV
jgi:CheY-like chemotaxis protein